MNMIKSVAHEFSSKYEWLNLRLNDVTSTEVSALFGVNPYLTEFELFHMKKNKQIVNIEQNERMKWGTRLESAIAEGIAEERGWVIQKMNHYLNNPDYRIGASFDYFGWADNPENNFILEVKNVDYFQYKDKWIDDGINLEAPPHIELQVQTQMMLAGCDIAYICALVAGNESIVIERKKNADIQRAILKRVKQFWIDIETNKAPAPNFERDSQLIISMNQSVDENSIAQADDELTALASEYKLQSELERSAQKKKEELKAKIFMKINTAEKVKGERFTITASVVAPAEISFKRDAYRTFKVNWRK